MLIPKKIHVFDEWNPNVRSDADIAVLKFEDDEIPLTRYIRPVCLWNFPGAVNETEAIAAGWSKSAHETRSPGIISLQAKLTAQFNGDCQLETVNLRRNKSRRSFCAKMTNATDVCLGDRGHGLFIKADDIFFLKGIASASGLYPPRCDVTNRTIYIDVFKFKAWIDQILSGNEVDVKNATGKTLQ